MADFSPNFVNPSYATPEQLATQRAYAAELTKRSGQEVNRPTGALANMINALSGGLVRNNANDIQAQAAGQNAGDVSALISQLQQGQPIDPNTAGRVYANPMASPEHRALIGALITPKLGEDVAGRPTMTSPSGGQQAAPVGPGIQPGIRTSASAGDAGVGTVPVPAPPIPGAPQSTVVPPTPPGVTRLDPVATNAWRQSTPLPPGIAPGGPQAGAVPPAAPPAAVPTQFDSRFGAAFPHQITDTLQQLGGISRDLNAKKTFTQGTAEAQTGIAKEDIAAASNAPAVKQIAGTMLDDMAKHKLTFGPTAEWSNNAKRLAANYAPGLMKDQLEGLASADSFDKMSAQLTSMLSRGGGTDAQLFNNMKSVPGSHNSEQGAEALLKMVIQKADQQEALRAAVVAAKTPQEAEAIRTNFYKDPRNQIINPISGNPIAKDLQEANKSTYEKTATNPTTGEKIGLRNGKWEPIRVSELPPGFVIDGDHSALPPGFVVDGEQPSLSIGEKAVDAYKGLGTGALKGTLALGGMVGDLTDIGARGIEKASNAVSDALGMERYKRPEEPSVLNVIPTTQSLSKRLTDALGEDFYKPKSDYGKAAESIGEFVPGAVAATATGGGSLGSNIARYAIAPGAATFAAEKALPETEYKPWLVAGAGMGASLVNPARAITPFPASAARQNAVDILNREGVTSLTAGQRTGNEGLRYVEDAASHAPMAGQGASRIEHEGQRQFTEAALRRAGTAGEATPEVLAANQRRLGQSFQDLSARNMLVPDYQFVTDITEAVRRYRNVPDSQQRAILQGYIDDIIPHVSAGGMSGAEYQPMRSMLSADSKSVAQSDPYLSRALAGIRNSLDDAMERSIARNNPADMGAWQTARREYAAQKLIEKAASRAGEATLEGQITAPNLRNAVPKTGGGYARGEGQFDELARAGATVMTPLPNSGTAQRTNAFHILNAGLLGIPQALAGRAVMSPPVQSFLANQLMSRALPNSPEARRLLMIELLQKSQQPATQAK